jgi:hypothetical protein
MRKGFEVEEAKVNSKDIYCSSEGRKPKAQATYVKI